MAPIDWDKVRARYPIFGEKVYLMTNGGGPMTTDFVSHATHIFEQIRDHGRVWELFVDQYEHTRRQTAQAFNSDPENVAFIQNTSWG